MGDVVLNFRGEEYRIPERKLFEIGDQIEDVARLFEIVSWRTSPHFHKLAKCLGLLLRFAGAKVTDQEIKRELIASVSGGSSGGLAMLLSVNAVLSALMEGAPQEAEGGDPGETAPAS